MLSPIGPPLQGFRYLVLFVPSGSLPQVLDMRFSKVSGLSMSAGVHTVKSGGQNLYDQRFPDGVKYENLILTRGMPLFSPLRTTFENAMWTYKFKTSNVFVMLLDESSIPTAAWHFENAWPVKWSFSELDASQSGPVIESMELAFDRFVKLL